MFDKIKKVIKSPSYIFIALNDRNIFHAPDAQYLKIRYWNKYHEKLNLSHPKTFGEKLQWLKIHDRKPQYTEMVDKYEAKQYLADRIGQEHIVPVLGLYDKFTDIDFDTLPNKFVIKTTHDSGGVVICTDKTKLDLAAAEQKINDSLKRNYYWHGREWPYKNVKPRILVEKLLENKDKSDLVEYNFFCCNGEPKFVSLCFGDKAAHTRYNDYYDMTFKKLPFSCGYPVSKKIFKKPKQFDEMVEIAKKLSKGTYFLRVDMYICNDRIYSSELTFYHWSGFCKFEPQKYNKIIGDYIKLPTESRHEK